MQLPDMAVGASIAKGAAVADIIGRTAGRSDRIVRRGSLSRHRSFCSRRSSLEAAACVRGASVSCLKCS